MASHVHASGLFEHFSKLGVAIIEYGLTPADLAVLDAAFPLPSTHPKGACAADISPGVRAWLADHEGLAELVFRLIGVRMRLIGVNVQHRTPHTTWFAGWQQSLWVDGAERTATFLEKALLLRIYLDDCDENGGPMEAIPGSHKHGLLDARAIAALAGRSQPVLCLTMRGDIVAIRPLAVRRSQRARLPGSRRVIEVEYITASNNS